MFLSIKMDESYCKISMGQLKASVKIVCNVDKGVCIAHTNCTIRSINLVAEKHLTATKVLQYKLNI